jgi:peptidoglycan/xylan/chitin deacetylase (PgdA/CDA1 family)
MRFFVRALWLCLIGLVGLTAGFVSEVQAEESLPLSAYPPVLMYHDIKDRPVNGFDVSTKDFIRQLDWLKDNGYQTLSMDEYIAGIDAGGVFPEKSILITFDDGYEGVYLKALPELKKRNMKATFFIVTSAIGTELPDYPYLTEDELKKVAQEPLISLESHSKTHPSDLSLISAEEKVTEMKESKAYLESISGKPCRAIAYPCGNYTREVIFAVRYSRYKVAFAVENRGLMGEDSRYSIPRIYMGTVMGEHDMKLFRDSVENYRYLPAYAFAERYYWFFNR